VLGESIAATVEVREIPIPTIGDGDVLLAISGVGIAEVRVDEFRPAEVRPVEIRAAEVCVAEVCPNEVRSDIVIIKFASGSMLIHLGELAEAALDQPFRDDTCLPNLCLCLGGVF
jgi:hypothetical protein